MPPESTIDKWATGQHLNTLRSTVGKSLHYNSVTQKQPISLTEAEAMPRFQAKIMPLRKTGRPFIVDSGASYHF